MTKKSRNCLSCGHILQFICPFYPSSSLSLSLRPPHIDCVHCICHFQLPSFGCDKPFRVQHTDRAHPSLSVLCPAACSVNYFSSSLCVVRRHCLILSACHIHLQFFPSSLVMCWLYRVLSSPVWRASDCPESSVDIIPTGIYTAQFSVSRVEFDNLEFAGKFSKYFLGLLKEICLLLVWVCQVIVRPSV